MKRLKTALVLYCLIFALLITIGGILVSQDIGSLLPQIIFLPIILYFVFAFVGKTLGLVTNIFLYYGFIVTMIMLFLGFASSRTPAEIVSSILFFPLTLYFTFQVIPKRKSAIKIPVVVVRTEKPVSVKQVPVLKKQDSKKYLDEDRRAFLKLIGSAGLIIFLFSIFTKRAHAAFFGSVPGPGTVAIKDTTGVQIDPAQLHPTDGYKISQLDDSSPAFYGFIRKDGAWFIMKEDSSGNYRYTKGATTFSTNWTNRATLTYDYFDVIF